MTTLFESKWQTILKYAALYGLKNFVETGSGQGDTLHEIYPYFESVFSVELADNLYQQVRSRFSNVPSIAILHGDSPEVLVQILASLEGPALFYLDAHYCGPGSSRGLQDTPILDELEAILSTPKFNGVILIDDLKSFGKDPAYPNVDTLSALVFSLSPSMTVEMIREGGGMILIVNPKKKKDATRKIEQVVPRMVEPAGPKAEKKPAPEAQGERPSFARPPMLYGPYREGKKGDGDAL